MEKKIQWNKGNKNLNFTLMITQYLGGCSYFNSWWEITDFRKKDESHGEISRSWVNFRWYEKVDDASSRSRLMLREGHEQLEKNKSETLHPRSLTVHPWKMVVGSWKVPILSYWDPVTFQGSFAVRLREGSDSSSWTFFAKTGFWQAIN